ncbi:hypothetical protein HYH03_018743 [Edaphochlamys debaryana]|uniref:Thioredoxin domain-containing protein n=1 Tax=Edaphochlamys debaryana TaxID=47281 RepID=A0A836BMN0_9CHLO|nr:hypothetical protein HYH03_018743 [Edaphochlamys debaryana]|eukprot:KAG2482321.1 hypothetical protein HYH03_018743 [Edaphochlamys debaryana]
MQTIRGDVPSYEQKIAELQASEGPHYILFTADDDPSTGLPWCPDCVKAVPPIQEVAAQHRGTLLELSVGPRSAWKGNAEHPFRTAPQLKVGGVPTLLAWGTAGATKRLCGEFDHCASPEEVRSLLVSTKFFS